MFKYFLTLFFSCLLFAANPFPFSALGDVIYDNVSKIDHLQNIEAFKAYRAEIKRYVLDVKRVKKDGYALEHGSTALERKVYLNNLRKLAKTNDFYKRLVETTYKRAIKNNNSKLFSQIINSGLLDTNRHKKEIINYYFLHENELEAKGVIKLFLQEDANLRAKKEAQQKRYKSKKEKEAERIRLIREEDRLERERLEKKLQEEFQEKKQQIRIYQQKELSKTI